MASREAEPAGRPLDDDPMCSSWRATPAHRRRGRCARADFYAHRSPTHDDPYSLFVVNSLIGASMVLRRTARRRPAVPASLEDRFHDHWLARSALVAAGRIRRPSRSTTTSSTAPTCSADATPRGGLRGSSSGVADGGSARRRCPAMAATTSSTPRWSRPVAAECCSAGPQQPRRCRGFGDFVDSPMGNCASSPRSCRPRHVIAAAARAGRPSRSPCSLAGRGRWATDPDPSRHECQHITASPPRPGARLLLPAVPSDPEYDEW